MTLDTDITFEMSRGSLYQLVVQLPKLPKTGKPWSVEKVTVSPPELLPSWSVKEVKEVKGLQEIVDQKLIVDLPAASRRAPRPN